MIVPTELKPIFLVLLKEVEDRRSVLLLKTIETEEQELSRKTLKGLRMGFLGDFSRHSGSLLCRYLT